MCSGQSVPPRPLNPLKLGLCTWQPLADLPHVLSTDELAKILRLSRTTAYDHGRRGLLPVPVIRSGRRMMVSKAALRKKEMETLFIEHDQQGLALICGSVGNRLQGEPVWLMLVGAPPSGKTELLMSLKEPPEVRVVGTLSEGGLLSGGRSGLLDGVGTSRLTHRHTRRSLRDRR